MPRSNLPARRGRRELARRRDGIYRDPEGGKLAGVCAGLAEWSHVPSLVWRLGFVLTTLLWGVGIPLYVVLWFVMDKRQPEPEPEAHPDDLSPEAREVWDEVRDEMRALDEGLRND